AVRIGAAAGRERDAVAAQEKLARGQGGELRGKLLARGHAGRSASGRRSKVETPAGRARAAGAEHRRAFPVPRLAVAQRAARAPRSSRRRARGRSCAPPPAARARRRPPTRLRKARARAPWGSLSRIFPFVPARGTPRRERRGDPVSGDPAGMIDWIPSISAFTRVHSPSKT